MHGVIVRKFKKSLVSKYMNTKKKKKQYENYVGIIWKMVKNIFMKKQS